MLLNKLSHNPAHHSAVGEEAVESVCWRTTPKPAIIVSGLQAISRLVLRGGDSDLQGLRAPNSSQIAVASE
jgi:hypothetical protein